MKDDLRYKVAMLFKLATTMAKASNLGFLLHKHPDRLNRFPLPFGEAIVAYPMSSEERCEVAMTVAIPFNKSGPGEGEPYVSDHPYAAGSYLASALTKVFNAALSGRCDQEPDLAFTPVPLEIVITPVPIRGITAPLLFEPLGWTVTTEMLPLDPNFPDWESLHQSIHLSGVHTVQQALRHVCVMLLVMTNQRHAYVTDDEVGRLQRLGGDWLEPHPLKHLIRRRFLRFRPLIDKAEQADAVPDEESEPEERFVSLQEQRIKMAAGVLADSGVKSVLDLGCGEGDLLRQLVEASSARFERIVGVDPSPKALDKARDRLGRMADQVILLQGAATFPDDRLQGFDAVVMLEVIEHLDPFRLPDLCANVFGRIRPGLVLITTPNRTWNETRYNITGRLRHRDHRFEWTKEEFSTWCNQVCAMFDYSWAWFGVGQEEPDHGFPTQVAQFKKVAS